MSRQQRRAAERRGAMTGADPHRLLAQLMARNPNLSEADLRDAFFDFVESPEGERYAKAIRNEVVAELSGTSGEEALDDATALAIKSAFFRKLAAGRPNEPLPDDMKIGEYWSAAEIEAIFDQVCADHGASPRIARTCVALLND